MVNMGVMDQLRTWNERHPDGTSDDWRVAQGNGWRKESDVIADARRMETETSADGNVEMSYRVPDNRDAVRRVANVSPDLFIERRPRGDRLVYALLRELEKINPDAGYKGLKWYESNRATLTVDAGSAWILRIRAKIAEGPVSAPVVTPTRPSGGVWAEWRALCKDVLGQVDALESGARFAVRNADGTDNDYGFWCIVNRPERGSTLPRYYLRQYLGGQGMVRVTMRPEAMVTIARRIKNAGPRDAMLKFGELLQKCGDCGRDLTNEESRALRVGPVCRARHAWLG
jgi:hypothetical protein